MRKSNQYRYLVHFFVEELSLLSPDFYLGQLRYLFGAKCTKESFFWLFLFRENVTTWLPLSNTTYIAISCSRDNIYSKKVIKRHNCIVYSWYSKLFQSDAIYIRPHFCTFGKPPPGLWDSFCHTVLWTTVLLSSNLPCQLWEHNTCDYILCYAILAWLHDGHFVMFSHVYASFQVLGTLSFFVSGLVFRPAHACSSYISILTTQNYTCHFFSLSVVVLVWQGSSNISCSQLATVGRTPLKLKMCFSQYIFRYTNAIQTIAVPRDACAQVFDFFFLNRDQTPAFSPRVQVIYIATMRGAKAAYRVCWDCWHY
jgi:hypothetical protein